MDEKLLQGGRGINAAEMRGFPALLARMRALQGGRGINAAEMGAREVRSRGRVVASMRPRH